jgi:aspartate kinase
MAYYGASVIHPKTLQPLQQKNIPFYVKSFLHPKDAGTKIGNSDINQNEESYILKDNQILLHIDTKDFSFIAEEHISEIFSYLAKYKIKVSLIQNSAISLAICIEDKYGNQNLLKQDLKSKFNIEIYENVNLFTVRNVNLENMEKFYKNKTILLEQLSKKTLQMITQS